MPAASYILHGVLMKGFRVIILAYFYRILYNTNQQISFRLSGQERNPVLIAAAYDTERGAAYEAYGSGTVFIR